MMQFVMALKAKAVSNNWDTVCRLCEGTLRSIFSQDDGQFEITVVCHDRPTLSSCFDARLSFIDVDYQLPQRVTEFAMRDKWRKIQAGLVALRDREAQHLMLLDADDRLHRKLVGFVREQNHPNGWRINTGYEYGVGRKTIRLRHDFDCGTNAVINMQHITLPEDMSDESRKKCIVLTHGHTAIERGMRERGAPLAYLPFPGAAYLTNHGDNDSHAAARWSAARLVRRSWWKKFLGELPSTRILSESIRRDFALDEVSSS